jgi:hypothetical protein
MKQTTQPLTKDEHLLFAKQIYVLRDALTNFARRHKKGHPAVKQAWRVERELGQLQGVMDDLYCTQFRDNPRPADPDFMDSPYISSAICERACESGKSL